MLGDKLTVYEAVFTFGARATGQNAVLRHFLPNERCVHSQ